MKRKYRFSDLDREHQLEVIGNIGTRAAAEKTVWRLVPDFPVELATAMAWDTSIMIFDDHVEAVAARIEREGVLRPILVDDLDEGNAWMEGRHRSIASEKLGFKTIPALVRIA